ncbi:MAG TPA: kelch repeat-containing protein [Thermomicrobiales bacterium]|nr:kelch repeat-containing protein [Thermomicrobiales bacterium]
MGSRGGARRQRDGHGSRHDARHPTATGAIALRRHRLPLGALIAALLLAGLLARAPAARAVGVWTPAASAPSLRGRSVIATTVLRDGEVLVTTDGMSARYDPRRDTWTPAVTMTIADRRDYALTPLADGRVLVVGGTTYTTGSLTVTASTEIYDPVTDRWTVAAPLPGPRDVSDAILLQDGRVLDVGGDGIPAQPYATALLYDPAADRWTATGSLVVGRLDATATRLPDGRVLVVGGSDGRGEHLASAEIYDPATGRWSPAATMAVPRALHTALPLRDGRVLVLGGASGGPPTDRGEIYDATTNRWTRIAALPAAGPNLSPPWAFAADVLPNGQVLLAGGQAVVEPCQGSTHCQGQRLRSAWRYDPTTDRWVETAPLTVPRDFNLGNLPVDGMAILADGRAFVAQIQQGPEVGAISTVTAETYTPAPGPAACFPETGQCIRGPFLAYWQAHGGLAANGYPLTDEFDQALDDGRTYTVQYFERVRLEYHPENPPPYDIELGQFGRRILQDRTGQGIAPPAQPKDGDAYFQATGHNVAPDFFQYWQANGGLAQFGYPLTEEFQEQYDDGKVYTVQYFERARFERHPENAAPWQIELGQFGRQILAEGAR